MPTREYPFFPLLMEAEASATVEIMRAILVVKHNYAMECEKFYDKMLKDQNLLHKVTSSEKYS